jgi:hypothetical protein
MSPNQTFPLRLPLLGLITFLATAGPSACRGELGYYVPSNEPAPDQKLWCSDRLCLWSVQEGEARPARSWHDLDPALSLVGPRVRLSRDDSLSAGKTCLFFRIDLQAPVGTSVRLEVDRDRDGTMDFSETLMRGYNLAEYWDTPPHFSEIRAREVPGTGAEGQPARVWLVKEGPDDAELYPRYVSLRACPPPVDAGR